MTYLLIFHWHICCYFNDIYVDTSVIYLLLFQWHVSSYLSNIFLVTFMISLSWLSLTCKFLLHLFDTKFCLSTYTVLIFIIAVFSIHQWKSGARVLQVSSTPLRYQILPLYLYRFNLHNCHIFDPTTSSMKVRSMCLVRVTFTWNLDGSITLRQDYYNKSWFVPAWE